ncbi:hypothetical protein FB45DRAFT_1037849 [Roridomyces roridus]|uniref:Protein kinase domain-containing protein n=1 Tax=Roridomyces roridus TaxID=1738132 RepID=A0AAD7B694_9AGAR|nr:hypothetical protein FB45DRAFT_1037849 [Roridomyces roridus]
MHLYVNPFFFSQLFHRVRSRLQELVVFTWPQDLASAVQDVVTNVSPIVAVDVKKSCDALSVWAPPISFEPPPPLPPPPPPDQVFAASDVFPSPTPIDTFPSTVFMPPNADELGTTLESPFSLVIIGLLVLAVVVLLAYWTCKDLKIKVDDSAKDIWIYMESRRAAFVTILESGERVLVSTFRSIVRAVRQSLGRLFLLLSRQIGLLLHRVGKTSSEAGRYIFNKLATVIVPWILYKAAIVILWLLVQAAKAISSPEHPTPLGQLENIAADNPVPPRARPPRPAPPPAQSHTTWKKFSLYNGPIHLVPTEIVVEKSIGSGAFGRVSRGHIQGTGEQVAIKRISQTLLGCVVSEEVRAITFRTCISPLIGRDNPWWCPF